MSNETPFTSDQAHHDREALKGELAKFLIELANEYPDLSFDQDEEYIIIRSASTNTEAHILRSKFVPQKDASPISIRDAIRARCEKMQ